MFAGFELKIESAYKNLQLPPNDDSFVVASQWMLSPKLDSSDIALNASSTSFSSFYLPL